MPSNRLAEYTVWVALADGTPEPVADYRLETDHRGRHRASALRYRSSWLEHPRRYALNPVHAPLTPEPMEWTTNDIPAVLDEVLPGRWERAVQRRFRGERHDVDDLHAVLSVEREMWRVGALEILPAGTEPPPLTSPLTFADIDELAEEVERTDRHPSSTVQALLRIQAGSSVGGARPKVLVREAADGTDWLVKLPRQGDPFDHVRLEAACLTLAEAAGIPVPAHALVEAGRATGLAVCRFDVASAGGRLGLVSANALLKDPQTQADPLHRGYDDLATLVRRHSVRPRADLIQLYAQMLFNQAINNRDDHLRNFSFLHLEGDAAGWVLSPAYDLVPDEALGVYSQLGLGHSALLPRPGTDEAMAAAELFQLTPVEARTVNDRLLAALEERKAIADSLGLSERERHLFLR